MRREDRGVELLSSSRSCCALSCVLEVVVGGHWRSVTGGLRLEDGGLRLSVMRHASTWRSGRLGVFPALAWPYRTALGVDLECL